MTQLGTMYVDIGETGTSLVIRTDMMQADKMRSIPGIKFRAKHDFWELPLSYPAWIGLRGEFGEHIMPTDDVVSWAMEHYEKEMALWHAKRADYSGVGNTAYPLYSDQRLRPAQVQAVDWIQIADNAILGDDPGAGKTPMACTLMQLESEKPRYTTEDETFRALVVCPLSVFNVWEKHVREWTDLNPIVAQDTAGRRRKAIDEWLQDGGVLIMNYQSAWRHSRLAPYGSIPMKKCTEHGGVGDKEVKPAACHVHLKELDQVVHTGGIGYMVLDEAHRISDPKTNQARGIKHLGKYAKRKLALTGTPIGKSPDQMWSVLNLLDPEAWPARGQFLDRYCQMETNYATDTQFVVGLKNTEEFYRVRDMYLLRRPFAEVTGRDITKVYQTQTSYLTPKHRTQYNEIKTEALVEMESGTMIVESDLVASTRLLQCSSSMLDVEDIADPDTGEVLAQHVVMTDKSPKLDLAWDWWKNDMEKAPVVFMAGGPGSRQLIDHARAKFVKEGVRIASVVGGMSSELRTAEVERYMKGEADVFFGQCSAAGEGLNLDRSNHLAFLQLPWSFIEIEQSENRIRRLSQPDDTIVITHFITEDSFDQRVVELYLKNKSMFEHVMQDTRTVKELM
jgi:SNF2 family DNA or RNA helicase